MGALLKLNLLGLLDHPGDDPALPPAHRPRLDDRHAVPDFHVVSFVVREKLRRAFLGLAVERIANLPLDGHHDALVHLVADDTPGNFRFRGHEYSFINPEASAPRSPTPSLPEAQRPARLRRARP